MIDPEQVEQSIRKFVTESFFFGRLPETFTNDDSFIELGILDSTGVLELVTFVESEFHISFEDDDLSPENLDSVRLLVAYVVRILGENASTELRGTSG